MVKTKIKINKTKSSRLNDVNFDNIQFGRVFSDHMFVADYADGEWKNFEILPFQNLDYNPAFNSLHYGQSVFEGMKAHLDSDNNVVLFRPMDNFARLNRSCERLCMATIDPQIMLDGLSELVKIDKEWIPKTEEGALYIRPFIFATDQYIGVAPSETYKMVIFTCPVNKYYDTAVKVKVEDVYSRAASGGTGFAKAAGNYAASLLPAKIAKEEGYDQLIWTDSIEHKYIEESGTMNLMVIIDGKIITPPAGETILGGITRKSVIDIARDLGYPVEVRQISVDEVIEAQQNGTLEDMFGTGTAVTITHISGFGRSGVDYNLPPVSERKISSHLKNELEAIKRNKKDTYPEWLVIVK
ncbi:MAG: branched chain amino acid aminotransferase [Flavobacteriales bacterium]|nr:branched chain amino acid aminotransferase [Flavobacteriales bacterium]MBO72334.1 branched chain amino acid aminotransferase [Flavobacteriales bacterium]|tara:strand:- start:10706 stop:11770 length:1065 start_codon:yes stop_codon:yes gene_type:complete